MNLARSLRDGAVLVLATVVMLLSSGAIAAAPASTAALPADPWPRDVSVKGAAVLIYQPQVQSWKDNRIDFRAAMAIKVDGATQESFGVVFANARTQVDKVARTVVFEDMKVTKVDFPTLADRGASYTAALQQRIATDVRTISLDRLQSSLALAGIRPPTVAVRNEPPRVFVSYSPAILVPIDGAPRFAAADGSSRYQRVINTRALILRGGFDQKYFMHVYDGWLTADSIDGPWSQGFIRFFEKQTLDGIATDLAAAGKVDLLAGGKNAQPKPSLSNGAPTIFTSQVPAELVLFEGQADFVPLVGTQLLWASNTTSDVFVETTTNAYYALFAGRWFTAPAVAGPWTFVASNALPADFAKIPPYSRAGAVLPTVAGTAQAQEAAIQNSIPQTATVPLANGPKFTPSFDGAPQYASIEGTSLRSIVNASTPIIEAGPGAYYAVVAGVWFNAAQVTGPWRIATSVPPAIYTIPPSSPLYYVTYVRIYEATPKVVYVGYTPGYLGTVISPYGTVVYGTGYTYAGWIGNVWYAPPYTYSVAAAPVYSPYVGFSFGFAAGLATAAWTSPYWGAYYSPAYIGGYHGYACCATASANVYGHWGSTTYSGTRSWYGGGGVAGSTFSGSYANARTGSTGNINAGRQYNAWTGNATRGYDRTVNGADGGSANVARAGNYNTYTGQRSTGSDVSGTTARGNSYSRDGATTAGPMGNAHAGSGSTYNATTGKTNSWSSASLGNQHYADVNGNTYHNSGDGWHQQGGDGSWSKASGDTSWADRESQARSTGDDRWGSFSSSHSFGGFDGGAHFGGGSYGGDRFGGGGFGGRFGGGGFRR